MERKFQLAADALRVALIVVGLAVLAFSTWQKHAGYALLLLGLAASALRFCRAPAGFDFAFVALLALDGFLTANGTMRQLGLENDRPGHLILTAAVTPILYFGARNARALPKEPEGMTEFVACGVIAAALTISLGTLWELVEWQSDKHLGTNMSLGYADTFGDLLCDVGGAGLGALILVLFLRFNRGFNVN